mgnify:FL=1|jgi:hypothetical protein
MKELGYYIISADLCGIAPYRREIFYKKTLLQYVEKDSIEEYSVKFYNRDGAGRPSWIGETIKNHFYVAIPNVGEHSKTIKIKRNSDSYIELKKQFRYVSTNKVSTAEIMHDLSFEDFLELARDMGYDITKRP